MKTVYFLVLVLQILQKKANGHGYMANPMPRNVKHNGGSFGQGDIQSMSGGGPAVERANGHGLCGDIASRRQFMSPNEFGGSFPTVSTYNQGETIDIEVVITAHHWGWFEFRLCVPPESGNDLSQPITQECLNQYVLEFDYEYTINSYNNLMRDGVESPADYEGDRTIYAIEHAKCEYLPDRGPTGSCCRDGGLCSDPENNRHRWVLPDPSKVQESKYKMKYKLPQGVICDRCVLQWYYQTGNSIDAYPEAFWNCADITIQSTPTVSLPPSPSPTKTTTNSPAPTTAMTTTSPSVSGSRRCHSIVDHISDEWCQGVNCDPVYANFCRVGGTTSSPPTFSTTPPTTTMTSSPPTTTTTSPPPTTTTTSPPVPGSGGCHSIVDHISDEWCRGVNCDPVYADFCAIEGTQPPSTMTTKSPTLPTNTNSPTHSIITDAPTTTQIGRVLNIIGYYGNSGNAPSYIPVLDKISIYYNTLIITFANFNHHGELELLLQGPYDGNFDQLKIDINIWKTMQDPFGRPRRMLFSIGGQNGEWPDGLTSEQILQEFTRFMDEFNLDGVDIDLEGSAVEAASSLEMVIQTLRSRGKIVSAAPEIAQTPLNAYSSIIPLLDYFHGQFYNNGPNAVTTPYAPNYHGSGWIAPPSNWQHITPESYDFAGQPYWEAVMKTCTQHFNLETNQQGLLIPTTNEAAGSYNNWDIELLKQQIIQSKVAHVGTWAVAYDNKINYKFARCMASTIDPTIQC